MDKIIHLKQEWKKRPECGLMGGEYTDDFRKVTCKDCKNTANYQWHLNPGGIGDHSDDYELFGVTNEDDYRIELEKWLSEEDNKHKARFPFIRDDVFLIANIDQTDGKQFLEFEKVNQTNWNAFTDRLECIHTAIAKISYDKFEEIAQNPAAKAEFIEKMNVQSAEKLGKIDLDLDEKFFAFKSWVQGIAEAGVDALQIQADIERSMGSSTPIIQFLFKNLIRADIEFLPQYLNSIEKSCRFEGVYHKTSLRANLGIILNTLSISKYKIPEDRMVEYLVLIAELDADYLFHFNDRSIKSLIASHKKLAEYNEYKYFFMDPDAEIRRAVASNPDATEFEEYKLFFHDPDWDVRRVAAANPRAKIYEEYKELIPPEYGTDKVKIARNPQAVRFPEFTTLFSDHDNDIKKNAIENACASNMPESEKLFAHPDRKIRRSLAYSRIAAKSPYYAKLFKDDDYSVRKTVARNPEAVKFPEFKDLFDDEDERVRKSIADNPVLEHQPPELRVLAIENKDIINLPNYQSVFGVKSDKIRKLIAANPEAVKYPEFKELFTDPNKDIRVNIALNPNAPSLLEYRSLFSDPDFEVRRSVLKNINSNKFPEYNHLFPQKWGNYINQILRYPESINYPEFKLLFKDQEIDIRRAVAQCPFAATASVFQDLFHDEDETVRQAAVENPEAIIKYESIIKGLDDPVIQARMKVIRICAQFKKAIENQLPIEAFPIDDFVLYSIEFFEQRCNIENEDWEELESSLEYRILNDSVLYDVRIIRSLLSSIEKQFKYEKQNKGLLGSIKLLSLLLEQEHIHEKIDTFSFEEGLCTLADKNADYIFSLTWQSESETECFIAQQECFTKYEEYRHVINNSNNLEDSWFQCLIAQNPGAVRFPEYKRFFTDKDPDIRLIVASNEKACKLPEFKLLLKDTNEKVRSEAIKCWNAMRETDS